MSWGLVIRLSGPQGGAGILLIPPVPNREVGIGVASMWKRLLWVAAFGLLSSCQQDSNPHQSKSPDQVSLRSFQTFQNTLPQKKSFVKNEYIDSIPIKFRGLWARDSEICNSLNDDSTIFMGNKSIELYESSPTILSIENLSDKSISLLLSHNDEMNGHDKFSFIFLLTDQHSMRVWYDEFHHADLVKCN